MKKQFQIPPAEDLPLLNGMLSSQPRTLAALFLSAGLLAACGGSGGEGQQARLSLRHESATCRTIETEDAR